MSNRTLGVICALMLLPSMLLGLARAQDRAGVPLTDEQMASVTGQSCQHCGPPVPGCGTGPLNNCDSVTCVLYCTGTVKVPSQSYSNSCLPGGDGTKCNWNQWIMCVTFDCECSNGLCEADMDDPEGSDWRSYCYETAG